MALIDTHALRRRARRELVRALQWTVERLRDGDELVMDQSGSVDAHDPAEVVAATRTDPVTPLAGEPQGAAAYVAEHRQEPQGDQGMLDAISGDMSPALAARAERARAQAAASLPDDDPELLHDRAIGVIHTIFDPEIPVDIYELGLIYGVEVTEDKRLLVEMTLTSPNCPAAQSMPSEVETKLSAIPGVTGVDVDVVFEPAWTPDLMSEEAKLELNIL